MIIEERVNLVIKDLNKNKVNFNIGEIGKHFNIFVIYNDDVSCYMNYKGHSFIYIKNDNQDRMWEDFTHELGHHFLHETDQFLMSDTFNERQECEAEKFSFLFQLPQATIEQNELFTQKQLMSYFDIDYNTALKRLRMLSDWYANESSSINARL